MMLLLLFTALHTPCRFIDTFFFFFFKLKLHFMHVAATLFCINDFLLLFVALRHCLLPFAYC